MHPLVRFFGVITSSASIGALVYFAISGSAGKAGWSAFFATLVLLVLFHRED